MPHSTVLKSKLRSSLALALCAALACSAQDAPAPHAPSITVTTRLVVLDVTVTDAAGRPVTDLTRSDFRVLDDDQPRPIRAFDPPQHHELPAAAASPQAVFDPAHPKSFGQSPVMVLVLDQLNTHFADSSFARRELHDYLARQPEMLAEPTTLLTLFDSHFHQLQGFTRSRDVLLKALAAAPVKNAWTLDQLGNSEGGPLDRLQQSLEALEQIAQEYARIPGRKNLLWVGGGFPTPDPTSIDGKDALEVRNTLRYVTDLLLETRVTLYAVDPTSSAAGLTEITTIEQANFAMAAGGLSAGIDPFDASDDFNRLAPVTGGRIVRGRNDLEQQIASAVALGDSYYTLAYEPDHAPNETAFHHIRVECLRPGLKVTTRAGYYSDATTERRSAKLTEQDVLGNALRSSLPWNALHVSVERASAAQGSAPPSGEERYIVHVAAEDLSWAAQDDETLAAHVVVAAAAFSDRNKLLAQSTQAMTATTAASTNVRDPAHHADFILTLRAAHPARVRFAVQDRGNGHIGTADLP